ncbi:hypothetical protein QFZ82_001392 [Streptomyces sp. V4I23]|uniref:aldehyde dehydrogenase family protein n=1 Tax=Streptomyces sp. V4I23 TaxID=3042282 RepID=UPI00277D2D8F|nr:aldehyde dehydrogenase family protein [Streptomyces sp. V4I23]MDQ1006907.1 hypothetical protein [Streptomyces sp. V4I23]
MPRPSAGLCQPAAERASDLEADRRTRESKRHETSGQPRHRRTALPPHTSIRRSTTCRSISPGPAERRRPRWSGKHGHNGGDIQVLADGARALTGGHRVGEQGYYIESTVLIDVRPGMSVVREEIFGPVVVAAPFSAARGHRPVHSPTATTMPAYATPLGVSP